MAYDPKSFKHYQDLKVSKETEELLEKASKVYWENFDGKTWYGQCIFLSWYCSIGDCKFCYRSTVNHKRKHQKGSRRSLAGVLTNAFLAKHFNWHIEFLTGGYGIMPWEELKDIIKNTSQILDKKIWLNLGILPDHELEEVKPYVKGIVSSMETLNPELHKFVCPHKPIAPYDKMFSRLDGFKKSVAVIVGLGEEFEDIKYLYDYIEKHNVDRVTMYALKPVRGTIYKEGPSTDEYIRWMASLRIRFPKVEIIAGTNLRRSEEAELYMRAGANAITKFPATKQFGTRKAKRIVSLIEGEGREFISNLTDFPDKDFYAEVDKLDLNKELKEDIKYRLKGYLRTFQNPRDKDETLRVLN